LASLTLIAIIPVTNLPLEIALLSEKLVWQIGVLSVATLLTHIVMASTNGKDMVSQSLPPLRELVMPFYPHFLEEPSNDVPRWIFDTALRAWSRYGGHIHENRCALQSLVRIKYSTCKVRKEVLDKGIWFSRYIMAIKR
jgi:hypothetical protein